METRTEDDEELQEEQEDELPDGAYYMGLDETGLPYWHVAGVGYVGEAWK